MMYFWKPLGDESIVLDVPKRILDIKVSNTVTRLENDASGSVKEFNPLATPVKCHPDFHFKQSSRFKELHSIASQAPSFDFYCLDNNIELQGSAFSDVQKTMEMAVLRC
jgi:hypothetical protein